MRLKISALFAVILLLVGGLGCTTNPETGRAQMILLSPQAEARMGLQAFTQIKQQEPISEDRMANDRVNEIGRRIVSTLGREVPDAEWEFVVFESEQVNAFALPGGKVGVYTGLIDLTETDDELAAIIGHEIAHVTLRHSAERMTQQMTVSGVALGAEIFMESEDIDTEDRMLARAGLGMFSSLGFVLPYSRKHETEADVVGLKYAAGAGYDPWAAITFWQKMRAVSDRAGRPLEIFSTHPEPENRIARLEGLAPQLVPLYRKRKAEFEEAEMNPIPDREIGVSR